MKLKRIVCMTGGLVLLGAAFAAPVVAEEGSCTGQFASGNAASTVPFGANIVVPEVQNLTLGGANLGQEVVEFFALADRTNCPIP